MHRSTGILFATLILLSPLAQARSSPAPDQALQAIVAQVRKALASKEAGSGLTAAVRRGFDFDELARRSLGGAWQQQSPADRARFSHLLRAVIEANYLPKVRVHPHFQLAIRGTERRGNSAVVHTVASTGGGSVPIDFVLEPRPHGWMVYDTVIDGVGLIDTYSDQFTRLLARRGMAGLIQVLEAKRAELTAHR